MFLAGKMICPSGIFTWLEEKEQVWNFSIFNFTFLKTNSQIKITKNSQKKTYRTETQYIT